MKEYLRQTHISTILLVILGSSLLPRIQAESQGIFELRLKNFANKLNKDSQGHCCDGYRTSSGRCSGLCTTKFRVCLKHYQLDIDPSHECTFGEHVTAPGEKRGSIIQFPLDFKWPVSTTTYWFLNSRMIYTNMISTFVYSLFFNFILIFFAILGNF